MNTEPDFKSISKEDNQKTPMTDPKTATQTTPQPIPKKNENTLRMVQTAVLAAILIVMAFTPLGYLKIGTTIRIAASTAVCTIRSVFSFFFGIG